MSNDKMREAFELAEKLEEIMAAHTPGELGDYIWNLMQDLRCCLHNALTQQPEREPVAWVCRDGRAFSSRKICDDCRPLYASPQPSTQVQEGWVQIIDRIVPALDPVSETECCEWSLWQDRERIRRELLSGAPVAEKESDREG